MSQVISLFPDKVKTSIEIPTINMTRDARKWAAALMLKMQIPEGITLVHYLGHGDETSNQQAIETWIMKMFSKDIFINQTITLDLLQRSLTHYLNDQQEDFTC